MKNNNICVAGGLGFVGSNIANALHELDYNVTVIDDLSFGYEDNIKYDGIRVIRSDFDNSKIYWEEFDTLIFSACINIIAAMTIEVKTFQVNAMNAMKLFDKFKGKIINLSTTSVYGNADQLPTPENAAIRVSNAYDCSKYIAELYLRRRDNYTTLRLSNVYGENQRAENIYCGVLGKMIDRALKDEAMDIYGEGTSTRDFTHINDVVDAVAKAVRFPSLNTEINIATGVETSVIDLGNKVWSVVKKPPKYLHRDNRKIDSITRRCLDISKANLLLLYCHDSTYVISGQDWTATKNAVFDLCGLDLEEHSPILELKNSITNHAIDYLVNQSDSRYKKMIMLREASFHQDIIAKGRVPFDCKNPAKIIRDAAIFSIELSKKADEIENQILQTARSKERIQEAKDLSIADASMEKILKNILKEGK